MQRAPFSTEELRTKLAEQLHLLANSIDAFDAGTEVEALQMATRVRVLLHNTKASHSLISQLGAEHQLRLPNTGEEFPPAQERLPNGGLRVRAGPAFRLATLVFQGTRCRFTARLESLHAAPRVEFGAWWIAPVLRHRGTLPKDKPSTLTRKDIVLGLANMEGGSHVDPNPKLKWWLHTRAGMYGSANVDERGRPQWTAPIGNAAIGSSDGEIVTPVYATMRTIAEETRVAITELLADAERAP